MNSSIEECVSKLEAVKHNYKWRIKDFHNWAQTTDKALIAPIFSIPVLDNSVNCRIELVHEIIDEDSGSLLVGMSDDIDFPIVQDALSLHLIFTHSSKSLFNLNVKISVYNNENDVYKNFQTWRQFYGSGEVHFYNFLKHSLILKPESNLLSDDTLTIIFEFTIPTGIDNTLLKKNQLADLDESEPKLVTDLGNLLKNELFSDLIVTASCGQKFSVHKNILTARSNVFAAMLKNEMLEKNQNVINITDIDGKTVDEMLHFIYTGKIDFSLVDAITMIQIADKYEIEDLKRFCENAISENIVIENAIEIFIIAYSHNAKRLKTVCSNFIGQNIDKVMKTSGFRTLVEKRDLNLLEVFYQLGKQSSN